MTPLTRRIGIWLLIALAMLLSFMITAVINQEIFMSSSPQLKPNLGSHLTMRVQQLQRGDVAFLAQGFVPGRADTIAQEEGAVQEIPAAIDPFASMPFVLEVQSIGVYAGERGGVNQVKIIQDQVPWQEQQIEIDGEIFEFLHPEDRELPSDEILRLLLQEDTEDENTTDEGEE